MGRLIDTDDIMKEMGEPKDYTEELVRNLICEFLENVPTARSEKGEASEWEWKTFTNGFETFKALTCAVCGTKRAQEELWFCAHCGRIMKNAEEVGDTDIKKTTDKLFHELMGGIT